jgi:hypothetical protein
MKQLFLVVITLLTFSSVIGQTITNNVLTAEHQNIAGTKISLIPPKGFVKADNFLGLQQTQSGSTIMVLDIPGPFSETSKGMTKEGFLSQGIEVKTIENLTLNNLPAILVTGQQNAYGNIYTKYVLCFGTDQETIVVNGASPNNLEEIAKEIKTSIITIFYKKDKKVNPFEFLDYKIDTSKSKLLFAKSMSNSIIFSVDGYMPTKSIDRTSLTIAKSFSKVTIEDRKLFTLNRLKQIPMEITSIETTEEVSIDGISGYEIIAKIINKRTRDPEKVYLVILFSDSLYYIFYGSTNQNFDDNINELRKVVKTFKRK